MDEVVQHERHCADLRDTRAAVNRLAEENAYLRKRERYLERLSVAALNALMAADGLAYGELIKRVEGWT